MSEPTRIPTRADDPPRLLLWSADEIVPIIFFFSFGIMISAIITCTVIGIVIARLYKKFCDLHADGFMYHAVYSAGFLPVKSRSLPNPFIRIFFP